MPGVQEAIETLRAALHKRGVESHVQDAFNNLASCLVLLNSSSPSVQMMRKLCTVTRQPLLPLYNACLRPAVQFSSSVLSAVLGKLYDAHEIEDESSRAAWDATAEGILSGILDFLDQKDGDNVESDDAVWEVLYRIICDFFFLDSGRGLPVFSTPLCLSAYNTLTEIAVRQVTIRNAFRQRTVLGGERLGAAISGTRDYLLLEALLMLFARLLPPTHNTSQGKFARAKFVKEVIGSQKLFKHSAELLDIMQKTSGTHWDDVAAQIIDVLARTDITYPQPFSIDEIDVCGRVFPQPHATDRLIMDKKAFLANIVGENDDMCESLQVPYSHIRTITLDNSEKNASKGEVLIMVYLTSPPLVANVPMKSPGASFLHAKFLLRNDDVSRFMEALRRRGVGKLSFLNPMTRVERKPKSISIGSGFKFTNDSSPIPPTTSFEGKVQHVNQVYKTDVEEPTTSEAVPVPQSGDAGPAPTSDPQPSFKYENPVPEVLDSAVAEDVPATPNRARLIPPVNETPKPIQNFALPFSPGNSTRTIQLYVDELSEISQFEPDNNATSERAATGVSISCDHELNQTQHKIDPVRMNGCSDATSKGIKKFSEPASKTADRPEGMAQRSPETGKPLLAPDSPIFCSSSSTQIDISPKLSSNVDTLLTTVGTEIIDAGKPQIGFSFAEDELGQHASRFILPSGTKEKVHSRIEITNDTRVLPKVAGSRRKRESIKSSSKVILEADDEPMPPPKKSRNDRHGIVEDKAKSNETSLDSIPTSRVKRYTKAVKRSSPGIDPTDVDFNELPEFRPTCQGTRRSSRIKKRQTAATSRSRANATRVKTQKGKQVVGQAACDVERKKSATHSPQDTGGKISHDTPISSPRPVPPVIRGSPFPKIDDQIPSVGLSVAKNITPETCFPRETPKASSILICELNQPSLIPAEEPREDLDFVQQAASDGMQLVQGQFHTRTEEIRDDQQLVDLRTAGNEVGRVQEVVEYSVSLEENEDPVEPSRPIGESRSRMETATIDLTIDDSPARSRNELHKASVDLARSKHRTPDCIAIEEPAFAPPPYRRRSVTFASPIEYVMNKKVRSKKQSSLSSNATRSRRPSSPSESYTLSPLRIPTGTVNMRCESPDRIIPLATLQNSKLLQASVHDQTADEAGIQDIVEVLNEIQAVIIKGISDKLRNVKKDVRHGRDELIQQVLGELRGMVVENAKYFNELLRLEEDFYKNGKAIIRCWEELIDCNDATAVQLQNALKEHDQNISARTFPKSLLPLQPAFPRRRVNA